MKKRTVKKNLRRAAVGCAKILKQRKKSGGQTLYTPEKAEVFCRQLAETAQVSAGAKLLNVSRKTVYDWREAHAEFKTGWDLALKIGMTRLEDEGVRRAVDGVKEPVYYKGEVVGHVQKYSDQMLAFMLSAHDEKYRTKRSELTGPNGTPLLPQEFRVRFVNPPAEKGKP